MLGTMSQYDTQVNSEYTAMTTGRAEYGIRSRYLMSETHANPKV
jgi:hypothetical protein